MTLTAAEHRPVGGDRSAKNWACVAGKAENRRRARGFASQAPRYRRGPPPLLDSASVTDEKEKAEAERVLGASASSASSTGGGELHEDPSSATKTRKSKGHWVFILVVVVVVLADAALLSAKFLFTHPQASPNGLPPGVSLAAFEARIEQQVRSRAEEGFGVASARSTRCFMGSAWAKGQQFSCFVYDSREPISARSPARSARTGARSSPGTACGRRTRRVTRRQQVRRRLIRDVPFTVGETRAKDPAP